MSLTKEYPKADDEAVCTDVEDEDAGADSLTTWSTVEDQPNSDAAGIGGSDIEDEKDESAGEEHPARENPLTTAIVSTLPKPRPSGCS